MRELVAACGAGLILMHMRGEHSSMHLAPASPDILGEIEAASRAYLGEILGRLRDEKVEQLISILDEVSAAARAVQQEGEFQA